MSTPVHEVCVGRFYRIIVSYYGVRYRFTTDSEMTLAKSQQCSQTELGNAFGLILSNAIGLNLGNTISSFFSTVQKNQQFSLRQMAKGLIDQFSDIGDSIYRLYRPIQSVNVDFQFFFIGRLYRSVSIPIL
jgi:hypothetical protein